MKRFLAVFLCFFVLSCISGCHKKSESVKSVTKVSANKSLPPEVAGTWQAIEGSDSPWRFVITPDGQISEATVMWYEVVRPNQTTEFSMPDCPSYLTGGDFAVEYQPAGRELSVSIELKDIHICLQGGVIDGNSLDTFVGKVSEDGKLWQADWLTLYDYGPDLPQGPNDVQMPSLIFEKVEN